MKTKTKNFVYLILNFLFLLNILAWLAVYDLNKPQLLEVNFFDVGQGEAIFIETPSRHQILIDGGPSSVVLEKLAESLPFWDRTIDLIILTHPEHDHLAGLIEVLKRYKVENILWTGVVRDTAEYKEWVKLIKNEGAEIKIAQAGQKINLSTYEVDRYMEVLYPFENLEGQEFKNSNNTSIVAKLIFGTPPTHHPPASRAPTSFLFTGDAYKSVEKKLMDKKTDLASDVLKVGHHGSKTSNSEAFIKHVSPEIAIISVGKDNPYHHPHQETLDTLEKYGIKILRTDKNGDIKIISNGINLIMR
ncbi:MAG: MBL fold metallo-hydrolase [Candidatus Nealsonbacteria bacterium]|nr:MAG: MBL fold metallo-hydrolase [Candidatus Nealsonbacteria bacterium]